MNKDKTAATSTPKTKRFMDIAKSNSVSRFAPINTKKPLAPTKPAKHPIEPKIQAAQKLKQEQKRQNLSKKLKPAPVIKQEAIAEAMAKPTVKFEKKPTFTKRTRFFSLVIGGIVLILLAIYLISLRLPSLSVQIAAKRAGINATYPEYHPDGYKLVEPISYKNNTVVIKFRANSGKTTFIITQTKSPWDSTAVRESLVKKKVGNDYITIQERGLTIYIYNSNAAWVNGGILYTIEGDAPLSSEQIRRIVVSF